jgi:hypothetical protein
MNELQFGPMAIEVSVGPGNELRFRLGPTFGTKKPESDPTRGFLDLHTVLSEVDKVTSFRITPDATGLGDGGGLPITGWSTIAT